MRSGRSVPAILSLSFGISAVGAPRIASASSRACESVPERVLGADAIIVGRTISIQEGETRPGVITKTYHFQIDEVLKGGQYWAGETITEKSTPRWGFGGTHLPRPYWDAHVLFMRKGLDGGLRAGPCGIVKGQAELPVIRRMVKVGSSPEDYLESTNSTDVQVILTWIARNYFQRSDRRREKDNSGADLPIDRDTTLRYLAEHASDETSTHRARAADLLGRFCEEEHYGLLKNVAEDSSIDAGRAGPNRGLRCIEARRDVPGLIDKLRRLRLARQDSLGPPLNGKRQVAVRPDQEYAGAVVELIDALGFAFDPDAAADFIKELEGSRTGTSDVGAQLGDETALAPILRMAWANPARATRLARMFDPEAVRWAREGIYDDRDAVTLLAAKGDEQVSDFMIRLLRQGHRAGASWAATVQDPSLVPDLVESLAHADAYQAGCMANALGRMRAWQVLYLLDDADWLRQQWKQSMFLRGLLNESLERSGRLDWSQAYERLREFADAELWPDSVFTTVEQLVREMESSANQRRSIPCDVRDGSIPWVPPTDLPGMPDPLATKKTRKFLRRNRERAATVLQSGGGEDKCKVLGAASLVGVKLDRNVVATLLQDGSLHIRSLAQHHLRALKIELTLEQLRRWALDGSYEANKGALRYMTKKADKAHAPIVEEVFRRGWHLFDEQQFRAIIATDARGCLDQLRGYVNAHHIFLRRWAAVTLAYFGDDTGRGLLKPKLERSVHHGNQPNREEVLRALSVIDPKGSGVKHGPPGNKNASGPVGYAVAGGATLFILVLVVRSARGRSQRRRAAPDVTR